MDVKRFRLGIVVMGLVLLTACASFSQKRQRMVEDIARGQYDQALVSLQKFERNNPNLMDLMDRGTILHLQGKYEESNKVFRSAEEKIEYLYAKSVTRAAGMYLINDLTQAYSGEEFERVYVNIMMAFNYIALKNYEAALVETRKIDHMLRVYADQYQGSSKYINHAFANYLSGILHEADGEINSAHISYRKAIQGYGDYSRYYGIAIPHQLQRDIIKTSKMMGFMDEFERYRKSFPDARPGKNVHELPDHREIIFLISIGKIAHKEERYWGVDTAAGPMMKVAYPEFVETPSSVQAVQIEFLEQSFPAPMVEDISGIAIKTLADRMAFIKGRAIARMLAKAGASAAAGYAVAKETDNEALGALTAMGTNILLGYTERADTRSWLSLPSRIHLVRVPVRAPMDQELDFKFHYQDAKDRTHYTEDVSLKMGKEKMYFVFLRAKEI